MDSIASKPSQTGRVNPARSGNKALERHREERSSLGDLEEVLNQPLGMATADFNGDGRPGVVTSDFVVDTISVLFPAPALRVEGHGDGSYAVDDSGTATIALTAIVLSQHGNVSFTWREGPSVLRPGRMSCAPGD